MDDLLDVQHLDQGIVHTGDASDERSGTGAVGGRFYVSAQAMHDAAHGLYVQALARSADLGDDQAAAVRVGQGLFADGAR